MAADEKQTSINLIFKQLNDKANLIYKFVMLYSDYVAENQDYGTGELINMVEVHTLTAIDENPGINISELANMWNRTKGAISQTATKLEKKGYIERRKQDGNAKSVQLFPTEKGIQLSRAHKRFDAVEVSKTLDELISIGCDSHELDIFFKVIEKYIEILSD